MANTKKERTRKTKETQDLSWLSLGESFIRLLNEVAAEGGLTTKATLIRALRDFRKAQREKQSKTARILTDQHRRDLLRESRSQIAKEWWSKVPEDKRKARARKAAATRWQK